MAWLIWLPACDGTRAKSACAAEPCVLPASDSSLSSALATCERRDLFSTVLLTLLQLDLADLSDGARVISVGAIAPVSRVFCDLSLMTRETALFREGTLWIDCLSSPVELKQVSTRIRMCLHVNHIRTQTHRILEPPRQHPCGTAGHRSCPRGGLLPFLSHARSLLSQIPAPKSASSSPRSGWV